MEDDSRMFGRQTHYEHYNIDDVDKALQTIFLGINKEHLSRLSFATDDKFPLDKERAVDMEIEVPPIWLDPMKGSLRRLESGTKVKIINLSRIIIACTCSASIVRKIISSHLIRLNAIHHWSFVSSSK